MSGNQKAVILVGHGGLPKDFPREIIQQFKQLERKRKISGKPATAQEHDLEKRIREWPRTPENDPYKAGLEQLAERLDAYFQNQASTSDIFQAVCGVTLPELIEQTGSIWPVKKNT